jgi:hypothetical protein
MRTSARRRDRGVQVESAFAGTRLHGAGAHFSAGGGSWAEGACSAPRGGAPKPGAARSGPRLRPECACARDRYPCGRDPQGLGEPAYRRIEPDPKGRAHIESAPTAILQ